MNSKRNYKTKTILVTGSTDGIGKQTALQLARMGHRVIIHGRNPDKAKKAMGEIIKLSGNNDIESVSCDLSIQREIHQMAEEIQKRFDKLDVLINNAGVYQSKRELTPDGLEVTFAVNHMAPFILTNLLFELLKETAKQTGEARVITVSSMIHASSIEFDNLQGERYFSGSYAYSLSKLCNVLFTYYYADMVSQYDIRANCLHPGVIDTKLLRKGWGGGGASPEEGAKNSVYLATSDRVKGVSGKYFMNMRPTRSAAISYDKSVQKRLWDISLQLWRYRLTKPHY